MQNDQSKSKIFNYATRTIGFDDCRFTSPDISDQIPFHTKWMEKSYHADMQYLERHLESKKNPELLLENVQSAIVLIKNYKNTHDKQLSGNLKVARYAAGKDYHAIIMDRLKKVAAFIARENPDIHCYCSVDSRPVSERTLAINSGMGFLGKNSLVIHPKLGSFFFIGVILTTHKFKSDPPLNKNCGQCRLCIDACPNNAIKENCQVDANRCISYLTIERKAPLAKEDASRTHGWIFGCDICQEACPYNNSTIPLTDWKEFFPTSGFGFNLSRDIKDTSIPEDTSLYRSRENLVQNLAIISSKI